MNLWTISEKCLLPSFPSTYLKHDSLAGRPTAAIMLMNRTLGLASLFLSFAHGCAFAGASLSAVWRSTTYKSNISANPKGQGRLTKQGMAAKSHTHSTDTNHFIPVKPSVWFLCLCVYLRICLVCAGVCTELGIDPRLTMSIFKCSPPYTRVWCVHTHLLECGCTCRGQRTTISFPSTPRQVTDAQAGLASLQVSGPLLPLHQKGPGILDHHT